ncbi:MAG: hypothetical protein QW451_02600 [Candidatus Aenigmatarchaeota archaeon]
MGGYSLNKARLEEELARLRMEYLEEFRRGTLNYEKEGVYLEEIDRIKRDLELIEESK